MSRTHMRRRLAVLALFALSGAAAIVIAGGGGPVGAAVFGPVTNTADDGSATSLRSIIENDATNAGGDTVILAAGGDYLLDCDNGDIDHGDTPLTIEGNGATIRMEDGCGERIFDQGTGLLTLRNVTIRDGGDGDSPDGAGFSADGPVVLDGAFIVDNHGDDGGGFDADGDVTIVDSVIRANTTDTDDDGGGFRADDGQKITIRNSTIADNTADTSGGGGFSAKGCGAEISIEGSTISGNSTTGTGGGFVADCEATVTIVNSTISGNAAAFGGGIDTESITLVYVTLAGNTVTGALPDEASAAGDDEGEAAEGSPAVHGAQVPPANLATTDLVAFGTVIALPSGGPNCEILNTTVSIGFNFADDASCGFTAATDRQGTGPAFDPKLGALADNGGATLTRLPQAGSPLVNAIPVASCGDGDPLAGGAVTTDQRGVARPQETGCEIGSVEIPAVVPVQPITFTG